MLYLRHNTTTLGSEIKKAITGRFIRIITSTGEKVLVKYDKYSNVDKIHDNCTYKVSAVGQCVSLTEEDTTNNRMWRECERVYNDIFGDLIEKCDKLVGKK